MKRKRATLLETVEHGRLDREIKRYLKTCKPPDGDGKACFDYLRENAIIVRYFPGAKTGRHVRITIGTPQENKQLLEVLKRRYL